VTAEDGFSRFSAQAGTALPNLPGVGVASAVLEDQARVLGGEASVSGIDPATIGRAYAFRWADGSPKDGVAVLAHGGALVKQSFADRHGLRPGSTFTLTTPSDRRVAVTVAGIFAPPAFDKLNPVLSSIVISRHTFASAFPRPTLRYGFVTLAPGARRHAADLLGRAIARYPGARVQTRDEWVAEQAAAIDKLLNLLYVLLALSVVVSLFGMINTLVLSVFERTRELGMLRTIGMTRRQARRMIRHESVITALIGAALGLPLGIFLAVLVTQALSQYDIALSIPLPELIAFTIVAILAGLAAAITPARRASRLNVLDALHYE